ncbi:acyl-CoA thioesterase [Brevibacillus sp. SYSU BS000544]|uniref:acyl-CoA thioesterase n=1 Tax=Brevibacillus sp. SYSU BS000544 TaxID=3416443 RepID=UPI003CE45A17
MYRSTQFRVRYAETDQMGVVYHTNYLNWFEIGRTELIRQLGFSYRSLEEQGVLLPVTDASISFKSPARYDDLVEVRVTISELTPLRLHFKYEIYRAEDETLLVFGQTHHVFTNAALRPIRLQKNNPEVYLCLETEFQRTRITE